MLIFLHHQPEINDNNNREITLWRNYLVAKHVLFTMPAKSSSLYLDCAFASLWRNSSSVFSFSIIAVYPKPLFIYLFIFFLKARKLWGLETRNSEQVCFNARHTRMKITNFQCCSTAKVVGRISRSWMI